MSDYWTSEIEIGGEIPKRLIPELASAADADCAGLEYGSPLSEAQITAAIIEASEQGDECILFCNDQARMGEFPNLENFCYKNKISYLRHSDAYSEYNGEIIAFRPDLGGDTIQSIPADQHNNPMLPLDILRSACSKGVSFQDFLAEYSIFEQELTPIKIV